MCGRMNEGARPALPPRVGKVGLKSNPSPPERSSHQERMGASGFKTGTIRLSSSDFSPYRPRPASKFQRTGPGGFATEVCPSSRRGLSALFASASWVPTEPASAALSEFSDSAGARILGPVSVSSMASLVSQVLAPHDRCSLVPRLTDFVAQRAPLRQYARLAQRPAQH